MHWCNKWLFCVLGKCPELWTPTRSKSFVERETRLWPAWPNAASGCPAVGTSKGLRRTPTTRTMQSKGWRNGWNNWNWREWRDWRNWPSTGQCKRKLKRYFKAKFSKLKENPSPLNVFNLWDIKKKLTQLFLLSMDFKIMNFIFIPKNAIKFLFTFSKYLKFHYLVPNLNLCK